MNTLTRTSHLSSRWAAWNSEREKLSRALDEHPADLQLGKRLWEFSKGAFGYQTLSEVKVRKCFREAALLSREGVIEMLNAYREMDVLSGGSPRFDISDNELIAALDRVAHTLKEADRENLQWLRTECNF